MSISCAGILVAYHTTVNNIFTFTIFLHQVEKGAELMKKGQILEFHMRFFLLVLERCQRLELYDVL